MATNSTTSTHSTEDTETPRQRILGISPTVAVWLVTMVGGIMRFVRFDVLGLWIDEGYSLMFTRMSWSQVLGLQGAYDSHPPLYFSTAKFFGLVFPEVAAGRLVSVIAGTLTLPVVYLLSRRVMNDWLAVGATAILAFSPLHLWYSREARMYVPSMLFVAVAYWALLEFYRAPLKKWAVVYGLGVLLAMYFSYSSFYALVPQLVLLGMVAAKWKKQAVPIGVGLAVAVAAYLPWLPQWLSAVNNADPFRYTYLGVQPEKVGTHLLGVMGMAERQYFLGPSPLPIESWPFLIWVFLALAVPGVIVGAVKLAQLSRLGFVTSMSLLGTILVAIVTSFVSPGLADRTIVYALIGWAILMGALLAKARVPRWASVVGIVSFVAIMLVSLVSDYNMYTIADKQRWQDLATDVAAVRQFDKPVLLPRPIDFNIIDAYEPGSLDGVAISDTVGLKSDVVWFAYHDSPVFAPLHEQLAALGYERVVHKYYFNPLYLDLYAKPGADVGALEAAIGSK